MKHHKGESTQSKNGFPNRTSTTTNSQTPPTKANVIPLRNIFPSPNSTNNTNSASSRQIFNPVYMSLSQALGTLVPQV